MTTRTNRRAIRCRSPAGAARRQATNGRHVLAVPAHSHAAFAAGLSGFARVEFVGGALRVCCLSALARDLALFAAIHRRKAAITAGTRLAGSAASGSCLLYTSDAA